MKYFLPVIFSLLSLSVSAKEPFSYLYIQGDKQTPFYVKLEDEMQPRYGKNYCIIPQLASGPAHIEILFQQNAFPPHKFTVLIPEGGSRGFLLVKRDTGFALYDLRQGFYLPANNSETDDHLPVGDLPFVQPEMPVRDSVMFISSAPKPGKTDTRPKKEKPAVKAQETPPAQTTTTGNGSPEFIPDIEFSQEGRLPGAQIVDTSNGVPAKEPVAAILNSDCPSAISSPEFRKIFNAMSANSGDEDRLAFILDKLDVCYETWQARTLAQMLAGEAARFTLLKKIYPRISDQAAFPLLDDLLSTDTWKAEFARLIHP